MAAPKDHRANYETLLFGFEEFLHDLRPGQTIGDSTYSGFEVPAHLFDVAGDLIEIRTDDPNLIGRRVTSGGVVAEAAFDISTLTMVGSYMNLPAHGRSPAIQFDYEKPNYSELLEWLLGTVLGPAIKSQDASAVQSTSERQRKSPVPPAPPPVVYHDETSLLNDYGSEAEDLLNRRGFATFMAKSIDELWRRNWTDNSKVRPSTIFNIYGRWGAGKTTFVRMIKDELAQIDLKGDMRGWKMVDFNAWQSQRIEPVWWALLERISTGLMDSEPNWLKRWWMRFREWLWRVGNSYGFYLLVGAAVLFGVGFVPAENNDLITKLKNLVEGWDKIVAASSAGVLILQSLLMGSESSARLFQLTHRDPMEKVRQHFKKVLKFYPSSPVLVFIDDLDRCQVDYVVKLLECTQTLLSDKQVFYIVAADRNWLTASFDQAYSDVSDDSMMGSRGFHFIEKIFQLSIGLPAVTPLMRERLLKHFVGGEIGESKTEEVRARGRAREVFAGATSEDDLTRFSMDLKAEGIDESLIAEEATVFSSGEEIMASREHRLTRFTALLEPNARSVKLVVNAYGMYINLFRTSGIIEMVPERLDQIALWSILNVRFPRVAEEIEDDPGLISRILEEDDVDFALTREAIAVVKGTGEVAMSESAMREMLGYANA